MCRTICALILFLLLTACTTAPKKIEHPFFWKATKGNEVIYLLGTVHKGITLSALPNYIPDLIRKADVIFIEIDNDAVEIEHGPEIKEALKEYYGPQMRKPYPALKSKLSAKAFANVTYMMGAQRTKDFLAQYHVNVPPTEASPALIETVFGELVLKGQHMDVLSDDTYMSMVKVGRHTNLERVSDRHFLDGEIAAFANANHLPLHQLDSAEFVDGYVKTNFTDPMTAGLKRLEVIFGDDGTKTINYVKVLSEIQDAYYAGDLAEIEKAMNRLPTDQRDKFINERNEHWSKNLASLTGYKTIFVAAGAGHFVGPSSVLKLINAKGFKVERFSSANVN
jgi:uncharacterized protein YbaP (TraB family)